MTDRRTDRQTGRQTDGQTSCHGIVRAMHTRRAVLINFRSDNISLIKNITSQKLQAERVSSMSFLLSCSNAPSGIATDIKEASMRDDF